MEFIKAVRRRSLLSEVIYIVLSLSLALGVFVLVRFIDPPLLAILLVLISKWRVLAVRPRFWFAHVQSNLVDIIVGLGVVGLLYLASQSLMTQLMITALYAVWLLVIKPRSKRNDMIFQAGVAQFIGITVVASFSYVTADIWVILGIWLAAYAAAHHVLSAYHEESMNLLSLVYAFIFAELAWIYYHWMVAYPIGDVGIAIPQLAIVGVLLGFVVSRLYDLSVHNPELRFKDIRQPILFVAAVILLLLAFFTPWNVVL